MRIHVIACLLLLGAGSAVAADLAAYKLSAPNEPLPARAVRLHFIDESASTPAGCLNPCAKWIDLRIGKALAGKLRDLWPRDTWQQAPQFLTWSVWAYLSPDSRFCGDKRLVTMMGQWIDRRLARLETPPEDAKKRAKWKARELGFWGFHTYSMPLLELLHRPALAEQVGAERVDAWRRLCIENVERWGQPDAWNSLAERSESYVNIATHPMAAFVHGWMLTGDEKYLRMAAHIVGVLARDQSPNGSFPYRHYGGAHLESETMYYHGMNVRGLYLYWWHTGSKLAEATLRKSAPYYPLRMAPKYHFEDACTIWWKDQWRTFWPNHIAMVAAAAGDGLNTRIANDMARDDKSADRVDLVLGWHAFQQMALRGVKETPRRDAYLLADPDIGGLRGRFGRFDFSFSTNSYSHTLAGATVTTEDRKRFGALHRACPFVRIAPLTEAHRTSPDYWCLGRWKPRERIIVGDRFAVAAATYAPFQPSSTWRPLHRSAPWKMAQVWLYTPTTMVGLMVDEPTLPVEAREVCHLFRFIVPRGGELKDGPRGVDAGLLRMRVHETNLPHRIVERVRRYELSPTDRKDWQVALSDVDRSPEHTAQVKGADRAGLTLPDMRLYEPGTRRYSVIEVGPEHTPGAERVRLRRDGHVFLLTAELGDRTIVVAFNFHDFQAPLAWSAPAGVDRAVVCRSWTPEPSAGETVDVEARGLKETMREAGVCAIVF